LPHRIRRQPFQDVEIDVKGLVHKHVHTHTQGH
jgi:hypothetical protein